MSPLYHDLEMPTLHGRLVVQYINDSTKHYISAIAEGWNSFEASDFETSFHINLNRENDFTEADDIIDIFFQCLGVCLERERTKLYKRIAETPLADYENAGYADYRNCTLDYRGDAIAFSALREKYFFMKVSVAQSTASIAMQEQELEKIDEDIALGKTPSRLFNAL